MKMGIVRARQLVLLAGDIACFIAGLFAALGIRYGFPLSDEELAAHRLPFALLFLLWFLVFFIGGAYNLRILKNTRSFFTLFFGLFGVNVLLTVIFFYFIPFFDISPKRVMFLDLGLTLVLLTLWRALFNRYVATPPLKLAVLGSGAEVSELIKDIKEHPQHGYECVFHAEHLQQHGLPKVFREKGVDTVAIAVDYRNSPELQRELFECISLHIQFYDFVDFYEQHFQRVPLSIINRAWFLENLNESSKQFFSSGKRVIDVLMAILLGVIGLVLSPFIAAAVLVSLGRPILYSQMRVSQFGKPFRIYKFRTMKKEDDDLSMTRIGRLLRKTHLDEIPQLWNILRGEMSFVGPRPEQVHLVSQLKEKIPFYTERLLVRPGITGWAQLHEPNAKAEDALSKLQYDLFYIKHRSFLLDLEIILRTLKILVLSK